MKQGAVEELHEAKQEYPDTAGASATRQYNSADWSRNRARSKQPQSLIEDGREEEMGQLSDCWRGRSKEQQSDSPG